MIIQVYRDGSPLLGIDIDESTVFNKTLMGDWLINLEVDGTTVLNLKIGDYITHKSKTYTINRMPEFLADDVSINYTISFEPDIYTLYDKLFRHLGAKTFTFLGTAEAHAQLIVDQMNTISSGWSLGVIDVTEELFITYDRDNCRTALTKICAPENFNLEYDVDGKSISIRKTIGRTTGLTFEVGQDKGLYELQRQAVNDSGVVTRAYGYGGTTNIGAGYRGGLTELIFAGEYLEKNVALYPNAKEGEYVNTDIFPQRSGTISAATTNLTTKVFTVTDTTIDFDIMAHLLENEPAKIVFTSGELSGSQFDILSHDTVTGIITFKEGRDIADNALPDATFQAQAGDKYKLVDLRMPQSYIDVAELQLRTETQEYLDANSIPQVIYNLTIDEKYIRDNAIQLLAGDYIGITDARLGISGQLRISAISYPLVNDGAVTATISNFILDSTANRIISAVKATQTNVGTQTVSNILQARRQTANLAALQGLVFDPDGYFDNTHIRPNSIETLYLSTGAKANDFQLTGVVIKPNVGGNQNSLEITGGLLLHNSISIPAGFTWVMSPFSITGLVTSSIYYLYARCSKTTLVGSFVVSTAQIKVDEEEGYFHFTIGNLYAAQDGFRNFEMTKGKAYLVGDTLTAGNIKSLDGQTYFNLTEGRIGGRIIFGENGSSTIVDGNLVTTSAVVLGNGVVNNAGISGLGVLGTDIRFWAGSDFAGRGSAAFRVDQNGKLFATGVEITGNITATSGTIGNVTINAGDLFSLNGTKVKIYPDAGITVLGNGYADFGASQMYVPTVVQTPVAGKSAIAIGNLSGISDIPSDGTVVSVGISVPLGLAVSNSPITSSGVMAITLASGYIIPLTSDVSKGIEAYGWGNHALAGYAVLANLANSATITASTTHGAPNTIVLRDASGYTNVSYINYSAGLESGAVASMMAKIAGSGDFLYPVSSAQIRTFLNVPTNNNQLTNGAGYITGITSGMVTTALGYTPVNKAGDTMTGMLGVSMATGSIMNTWSSTANPSAYATVFRLQNPSAGVVTYNYSMVNAGIDYDNFMYFDRGIVYFTKIVPSTLVIPSSTPSLTSGQSAIWVGNLSGIVDNPSGVTTFNSRSGAVTLTSTDVSYALGYVAVNKSGDTMSGSDIVLNIISSNASLVLGLGYQGVHGQLGGISNALYAFSANGGITLLNSSSAWVAASDINRKKDIEPYGLGLEAILRLEPVEYRYKSQSFYEKKNTGFIAQQVQDIIESAYCENGDFIGLDFNAFIPVLVNAVKTLHNRVLELEGGQNNGV